MLNCYCPEIQVNNKFSKLYTLIYIYISLLPPWFGDLHTYVTKQKNNNEKKVKMKEKENNKQKYKQLHSKTGIKDTNWKKSRRKKWYIRACFTYKVHIHSYICTWPTTCKVHIHSDICTWQKALKDQYPNIYGNKIRIYSKENRCRQLGKL